MVQPVVNADASRALLELTHHLLTTPVGAQPDAPALLAQVASAADAHAAGLVSYPDARHGFLHPIGPTASAASPGCRGLTGCRTLSPRRSPSRSSVTGPTPTSSSASTPDTTPGCCGSNRSPAATAAGPTPRPLPCRWSPPPSAGCWSNRPPRPRWGEQLDLAARQQRLEAAAAVTRRLAHDFGNVLTGILGFTELALAQQTPSNASLHAYLNEA